MKKSSLPPWLLDTLGHYVVLKVDFDDGVDCWPAGTLMVLQSIQAGYGKRYVTLSPVSDPTLEENFEVKDIEPFRLGFQDVARPFAG